MPLSESKSKKGKSKNPRSQFLSALMKTLGGDTGDALASAFVSGDSERFNKQFAAVGKKLAAKMESGKSESSAPSPAQDVNSVVAYAREVAPMLGMKLVETVTMPRSFGKVRASVRFEPLPGSCMSRELAMSSVVQEVSAFASCCCVAVGKDRVDQNVLVLRNKAKG